MNKDDLKNNKGHKYKADGGRPTMSFQGSAASPVGQIGPYKLINVLGEGGFSVVYLAEQDKPVKRFVALKVIKPGMDTKQVIARFEAERQTLALLNHPNIAAVYDAGATEAGLPYFVMENVKGIPITEHCDKLKLGIEERLELFLQVCDAVQYAHQKGIIHRDIKPSNILVSVDGQKAAPRIIDFGVSKAITQPLSKRTLYTEQGQFVGTPEYMSPEQAEMGQQDIDTRSDVYSLGVVLYELLTGTLPFDPDTLREGSIENIKRIIREQDPKRPSTRLTSMGDEARKVAENRNIDLTNLKKRLNRELEWIPLKAMRKDRTRRYRSASEFADDIRNYLNGRPLIAGPESAAYRLKKLARRNGKLLAGIATVLIVMIIGTIVSTNFAIRAAHARHEAEIARQEAEQEAKTAQTMSDFLRKDLLESMDPYVSQGQDVTVRSFLDSASRKLEGKFKNEPLIEAMIRYTLGKTYRNLGTHDDLERAEKHLVRAYELQSANLGENNKDTLNTKELLGSVYLRMGRFVDAFYLFDQTVKGRTEIFGPNDPSTLSATNELAMLYLSWGQYPEAEKLFTKTLAISLKKFGEKDAFTLLLTGNLADVYRFEGRYDEAEKEYIKVQANTDILMLNSNSDTLYYTLYSMNGLGMLYVIQGKYDLAEQLFNEAYDKGSKILGQGHPDTLYSMNGLGIVYTAKKEYDIADHMLTQALKDGRNKLGYDNPTTLTTLQCMGILEYNRGYYTQAEQYLQEALAGRQAILGYDHPATLESQYALAMLYKETKRYTEAEKLLKDTLKSRIQKLGAQHPDTIETQEELDDLEDLMGNPMTDPKTDVNSMSLPDQP